MREVREQALRGRHATGVIRAGDLEIFDVLDSGAIVTSVSPEFGGFIEIRLRANYLSGGAELDVLHWNVDTDVKVIASFI